MWSINVYSIVKKIKQNLKRYVVLNIHIVNVVFQDMVVIFQLGLDGSLQDAS